MSFFRHVAELIDVTAPTSVNLRNGDTAEKQTAVFDDTEVRDGNTYGNQLAVTFFGKSRELLETVRVGARYRVSFRIRSRQYNGAWYTNLDGFALVEVDAEGNPVTAAPAPAAADLPTPPPQGDGDDGLPF